MKTKPIRGVIPAVMTPLKEDGSIDYTAMEQHMAYLSGAGVDGFFIGGTTAEGPYLTAEERKEAFRLARSVTAGKQTLYVVILRPHTEQVIAELLDFMELEPEYAAAVTPFYYGVSQQTIADHYRRIADASPVPTLLYNIPQNTHNPIRVETVLELADHPNIAGIKDSAGNFLDYTHGLLETADKDFAYVQGEDRIDAPSLLLGAPALVTGLGNVHIEPYVRMFQAAVEGDRDAVKKEQRMINAMAGIIEAAGGAVIPAIKMAAAILGRGSSRMRIAGDTLDPKLRPQLERILAGVGLL